MTLPQIDLDDRRFMDLVFEARQRITRSCPEWSEHNISDPGVTLIEMFAWMTEMLIYRVNRVPDKLHMTLLELMGVRLNGPSAAQTTLTFIADEGRDGPVLIPSGTQVSTVPLGGGERVTFATQDDVTIPVLERLAVVLEQGNTFTTVEDGDVPGPRPEASTWQLFGEESTAASALYFGFDEPLENLIVEVRIDAEPAQAVGIDATDSPVIWEVAAGDAEWEPAVILADTSGGLTYGSGVITLQTPSRSSLWPLAARRLHWLRCRLAPEAPRYIGPATLRRVDIVAVGVAVPAVHAGKHENELLGVSDGTWGQRFALKHRPVLRLEPGEMLAVRSPETGDDVLWELRDSFEGSSIEDAHFCIDTVTGTVELGPAVRDSSGGWRFYGDAPQKGSELRFTRYRAGGGRVGNVSADRLTHLDEPIRGIASVTNPAPAIGGIDAETLESARTRASMQVRTRWRAVTAEDFEFLAKEASPRIARAFCMPPGPGDPVALHLLPRIVPADRPLAYDELTPDEELFREVGEYIDGRRLIGTTVELLPCRFRGLSVVTALQVHPLADPGRVEADVAHALNRYLNPLVGGPRGDGWPFGRACDIGVLSGIVHEVDGVDFVKIIRVYETDLRTGEQAPAPAGSHIVLEADELVASGTHIVKATAPE